MKVYCKRTKFNHGDDESKNGYVKWKEDCWYEFRKPEGYESKYIFGYVTNNSTLFEYYKESISKTDFDKYFYTMEDLRELRINNILKDDSNRM